MRIAVYPGSFDPVTLGHGDIIERTAKMFDKVIIGVLNNNVKTPLFSAKERVNMLEEVTAHLPNVEVQSFEGLLVDFLRRNDARVIVRGLRAVTDFEYELQMAQTNRVMAPEIDTIFLTTNLKYSYSELQHCEGDRLLSRADQPVPGPGEWKNGCGHKWLKGLTKGDGLRIKKRSGL